MVGEQKAQLPYQVKNVLTDRGTINLSRSTPLERDKSSFDEALMNMAIMRKKGTRLQFAAFSEVAEKQPLGIV